MQCEQNDVAQRAPLIGLQGPTQRRLETRSTWQYVLNKSSQVETNQKQK
jgi:hypothetical protein